MIQDKQRGDRKEDAITSQRGHGARGAGIGRQLREVYSSVVHEPVPAEFRELLEQLKSGEGH
ncbi:NepR family anti-sigma factor [Parvibaculum sp.]|uniref:NepR family anti-sigma factor n=1 Tax=Parvibaculum sp. TaxID=2024848 RepID=UPI003C76DC1F